jgi:hypothetical protein
MGRGIKEKGPFVTRRRKESPESDGCHVEGGVESPERQVRLEAGFNCRYENPNDLR